MIKLVFYYLLEQGKYLIRNYFVFIEVQMAKPVFYLVLEQKEYSIALEKYIQSIKLKNYYVSTKAWIPKFVFHLYQNKRSI